MINNAMFYKKTKDEKKKAVEYFKNCVKCEKCGHSIYIGKNDKVLCSTCGRYLFKDKKTEFDYRMRGLI